MSTEIFINVVLGQIRVATLTDTILTDLSIERAADLHLPGNIYLARVTRILPSIQAAFLDIGLSKEVYCALDKNIHQQGQVLLVQIIKAARPHKAAEVTTELSLAGRYLIFKPMGNEVQISRQIDTDKREQLQAQWLTGVHPPAGGWMIRTAAAEVGLTTLKQEISALQANWRTIQKAVKTAAVGTLLYKALSAPLKLLRDYRGTHLPLIRVDCVDTQAQLQMYAHQYDLDGVIELYQAADPLFEHYHIEAAIQQALLKKVMLPSGGYLIIDENEAMTTIDVNTGADTSHTIGLKTNLEAVKAVASTLKLRNISGLIVIDFIKMQDIAAKQQVIKTLKQLLAHDSVKTTVSTLSKFGLMEVSRQRSGNSLREVLCTVCTCCDGQGMQKSWITYGFEIVTALMRKIQNNPGKRWTLLASAGIADYLLKEGASLLQTLVQANNGQVHVRMQPSFSAFQYDIILEPIDHG